MAYQRPTPLVRLTPDERRELLQDYFHYYRELAELQPDALNRKIPREAFSHILDGIGEELLRTSERLANEDGPVRDFLEENPLPASVVDKLPQEFRAFCLLLNSLKQWVVAEQAATDRYLLGGTARQQCRAAAANCLLSGEPLVAETTELHHPVRDGRPPIAVSKAAHSVIEGQTSGRVRAPRGGSSKPSDTAAEYRASRLLFRASVIEQLSDDDKFRIITPEGVFQLTKLQFRHAFRNVVESATYRDTGVYSYSATPRKAYDFLWVEPV